MPLIGTSVRRFNTEPPPVQSHYKETLGPMKTLGRQETESSTWGTEKTRRGRIGLTKVEETVCVFHHPFD